MSDKEENIQVKVGDIFYTSWGYDQTNIDYVKVIGISKTGKSVTAISIGQKTIEITGYMSETVVADSENETSKPYRLKIEYYNDKPQLRGSYVYCGDDSKRLATLWQYDGHAKYQSHYA